MTRKSVNLEQRVLQAVHEHFRVYGCSPSYIDIGLAVGIDSRHVGRPLAGLARRGLLSRTPGAARSIVLADRMAGFSDVEVERAVHSRGGAVTWSRLPELAKAFAPAVAMCGMAEVDDLAHLLDTVARGDDGAAERSADDEAEQGREGGQDASRRGVAEGRG